LIRPNPFSPPRGVDEQDRPILRQNLSRARFEKFLGKVSPTEVVLEACGSSHHWSRFLQGLGHTVRPIPLQYVKPFVKRGENDRYDAEAICEAASRPAMRSVPVKSAETQAEAMDLSARDLLVRQRTQSVNAVRGHAPGFGIIAAKGVAQVEPLLERIMETDLPSAAKGTLAQLGRCIDQLDAQLAEMDRRLAKQHRLIQSVTISRRSLASGTGHPFCEMRLLSKSQAHITSKISLHRTD
jgi:transposase